MAAKFFLDDVPGAIVPASRLRGILENVAARKSLTPFQESFLCQNNHQSLLFLAQGAIGLDEFNQRAAQEREVRAAKREIEAKREAEENARRAEISNRKNAALFVEQERRQKEREILDQFDLLFVRSNDLSRVNRILRSVKAGEPIGKKDLVWLAAGEGRNWTDRLRKAHHMNLAAKFREDWSRNANVWSAVNSCSHWRKAERPTEGVAIAKAALEKKVAPKMHSALLTTGGGALRDLKRFTEAASFGRDAHSLTPKDHRPCTLLGAVHIEMGAYQEGVLWYQKAEALGASRDTVDRELRSILSAAPKEIREQIKRVFKNVNATRYGHL